MWNITEEIDVPVFSGVGIISTTNYTSQQLLLLDGTYTLHIVSSLGGVGDGSEEA